MKQILIFNFKRIPMNHLSSSITILILQLLLISCSNQLGLSIHLSEKEKIDVFLFEDFGDKGNEY